jgi:hypothetical protein
MHGWMVKFMRYFIDLLNGMWLIVNNPDGFRRGNDYCDTG